MVAANPIYIQCESMDKIKKIDEEKLQLKELLRGYHVIQRETEKGNPETPEKKNKTD